MVHPDEARLWAQYRPDHQLCGECDGDGIESEITSGQPPYTETIYCKSCGGTGKVSLKVCLLCNTWSSIHAQERETEREYARTMDPILSDVRPTRELRGRLAYLRLGLQRRCECGEGHTDE